MVGRCHLPKHATKELRSIQNVFRGEGRCSYHVLPAEYGTLQNPTYLFTGGPGVERIVRNNIGTRAIKCFSVDFKMPLISGRNSASLNVLLRIRRLDKRDSAKTGLSYKTRGRRF